MSFYLMHRGWMDHHLFRNQTYSEREAWEYLIATANYAVSKFRQGQQLFEIFRGEIATSYRSLAIKWRWSPNKVIRFLKLLIIDSMIDIKTEHGFLRIIICNYEDYQSPVILDGTAVEHEQNSDGTQTNTNQKKINNKTSKQRVLEGDFSIASPVPKKEKSHGSRLADNWELPQEWGDWAESLGMKGDEIIRQAAKFKNHWNDKTGKNATKRSWKGTWENWIYTSLEGFKK